MIEKIILDMLTQDSVSVKKQNVTTIGGKEYIIGEPWRRAYVNSTNGRTQLQTDLELKYVTAIFSVWGDVSTVTE